MEPCGLETGRIAMRQSLSPQAALGEPGRGRFEQVESDRRAPQLSVVIPKLVPGLPEGCGC
jgi:hypothetical protein